MSETRKARRQRPGVIDPQALYTLREMGLRLGWEEAAFRTARRKGLRVLYAGGRAYVKGSDAIKHIEAVSVEADQ